MPQGTIEYNQDGKPICEICGKSFHRLLSHVRQKHQINEREYKLMYGLDLKKGICSKKSSQKSRRKALLNYNKVIKINLLSKGKKTQFKKGSKGRTKENVSTQTRKMLKERLKKPYMVKAMKKSGRRVGKSGLGNKVRWGQKYKNSKNHENKSKNKNCALD